MQRPDLPQPPSVRQDPFLVAPTTGYQVALAAEDAQALETAYRSLMRGGSPDVALDVASRLAGDPAAGPPAAVLASQAEYALKQCGQVVSRLGDVIAVHPDFLAANLVLGRCREEMGDLPGAAELYHRASDLSAAAAGRLADIGPRARDAALGRIRGWIEGGYEVEARAAVDSLQRWAPRDVETLSAIRELAEALGDRALELQTARQLTAMPGGDRDLYERRAELEIEIGDVGSGLRILEDLVSSHPDDPGLAEGLVAARFAWRMSMLPERARTLASSPELTRGELATLLYWIFPSVRYGRPSEAVIANDVLDHEYRTEIVRIVNLGIMEIDLNLHAFRPRDSAVRADALRGLLRVLAQGEESGRCLGGTSVAGTVSLPSTCSLAARCGLLEDPAGCLPEAVLSGSAAMKMIQKTAVQLEPR